jgi:glutamine amidotransferase/cyclase
MQVLFEASDEAPGLSGLGVVPARMHKFDTKGKAVPHMGWNGAIPLKTSSTSAQVDDAVKYGFVEDGASYYFVHSYNVPYEERLSDWALTATQYGDETFISSVQKDNVFATQFHPEKSGKAGLNVLHAWLSQTGVVRSKDVTAVPIEEKREALKRNGYTKRIVACLDVRANDDGDLVVTKGDQYDVRETQEAELAVPLPNGSTSTSQAKGKAAVRNLGKPVDLARRYYDEGADEICFLNITSFRSCPLNDQPMLAVVAQAAETVFVPLTIGGGIRDTVDPDGTARSALDVASAYFAAGADKVSIGSDAVFAVEELLEKKKQQSVNGNAKKAPLSGITAITENYGSQAVVVSVDPKRVYVSSPEEVSEAHRPCVVDLSSPSLPSTTKQIQPDLGPNGEKYCWYQCTVRGGRETRDLDVVQLVQGVAELGAGEILLNSVDKDGQKSGFDLRLVDLVKRSVSIPVVASSGAGTPDHFVDVFEKTDVEAALAAGIFHRKEVPIEAVKETLRQSSIPVRKDLVSP